MANIYSMKSFSKAVLCFSIGFANTFSPTVCKAEASKPRIFFVSPASNAEVKSPFKVEFGVEGFVVHPAGELKDGTGHHHLIINGVPIAKDMVVPANPTHIHFGKGQTSTEVTLAPGKHTLTLQFADGAHRSYGKEASDQISINVLP